MEIDTVDYKKMFNIVLINNNEYKKMFMIKQIMDMSGLFEMLNEQFKDSGNTDYVDEFIVNIKKFGKLKDLYDIVCGNYDYNETNIKNMVSYIEFFNFTHSKEIIYNILYNYNKLYDFIKDCDIVKHTITEKFIYNCPIKVARGLKTTFNSSIYECVKYITKITDSEMFDEIGRDSAEYHHNYLPDVFDKHNSCLIYLNIFDKNKKLLFEKQFPKELFNNSLFELWILLKVKASKNFHKLLFKHFILTEELQDKIKNDYRINFDQSYVDKFYDTPFITEK